MKIEMGESLFYSWLRHIKGCQLVQTNWKASPRWTLHNEEQLTMIQGELSQFFSSQKLNVFGNKNENKLSQFLRQAECDALGIATGQEESNIYAVDVAFHSGGLLYRNQQDTVAKVLEKCIRNAMCIYGYYNTSKAEVIFASPKISEKLKKKLDAAVEMLQEQTNQMGLNFHFQIIGNSDFKEIVLDPVLKLGDDVADTTELFLRSNQLVALFSKNNKK